jgi:hypothetical protein
MRPKPKAMLREFYAQALLTLELLCLHCSQREDASPCPPSRRDECLRFLGHMACRLGAAATPPRPHPAGPP